MDELLRARQEIEAEIETVKATDNTAAVTEEVERYRIEITERYAKEKADKLAELEVGLRYINRAIDRAAMPEATEEVV